MLSEYLVAAFVQIFAAKSWATSLRLAMLGIAYVGQSAVEAFAQIKLPEASRVSPASCKSTHEI